MGLNTYNEKRKATEEGMSRNKKAKYFSETDLDFECMCVHFEVHQMDLLIIVRTDFYVDNQK